MYVLEQKLKELTCLKSILRKCIGDWSRIWNLAIISKVEDMHRTESFAESFALLKEKRAVWIVHQHIVSAQPILLDLTLL